MAYTIQVSESNASRRVLYVWCVGSNGTSPATGETGGQPQWGIGGVYKGSTSATLSAMSANAGEYFVTLTASEVSVIGPGIVRYNSANCIESATPFQVVGYDSADTMRLGLFSLPNGAPNVSGGLPLIGNNYASTLTVGVAGIAAGTYSGVTVGSLATLAPANYTSAVTVGMGSVAVGSGQSLADALLTRNIASGSDGGRDVRSALYPLRNKIDASSSVLTVYDTTDVASAWTASTSTGADPLSGIDPT